MGLGHPHASSPSKQLISLLFSRSTSQHASVPPASQDAGWTYPAVPCPDELRHGLAFRRFID
jgi:hypothetical protein